MSTTIRGENPENMSDVRQSNEVKPVLLLIYDGWMISQWINYTVVGQIIDVFGIATNIINIICFVKQGFKESVNVSLIGLAISDLGCLTTLIWTNICMTPAFSFADLPFDPLELQHLTSCLTHTTFSRLTGCITAFITLERCLCITAPLKVKNIVTPKRVQISICCIFMIILPSLAPVYVVSSLDMKFFPEKNKSLIAIVYNGDRKTFEKVSYLINNVVIPFSSFLVIIICTIVLVVKLHSNATWRKNATNSAQADDITSRNQKVAKMVLMISTLFIFCFFPFCIIFLAMAVESEFSYGGIYMDHLIIVSGFGFILESINSSVNIFFYYRMSSKYRLVFRQLFHIEKARDKVSQVAIVSDCAA